MRIWIFLLIFASLGCRSNQDLTVFEKVREQLPDIGGFMLRTENQDSIANWLGRLQNDGRQIYEPINLVIVDDISQSAEAARSRLMSAFSEAGFRVRPGHSSDYFAWIGGTYFSPTPSQNNVAFSDFMWIFTNNHTRAFGPYRTADYWVWVAASSREKGTIHDYVSFATSRDKVAENLVAFGKGDVLGKINLGNAIQSASYSTGDHDGFAPLIKLK